MSAASTRSSTPAAFKIDAVLCFVPSYNDTRTPAALQAFPHARRIAVRSRGWGASAWRPSVPLCGTWPLGRASSSPTWWSRWRAAPGATGRACWPPWSAAGASADWRAWHAARREALDAIGDGITTELAEAATVALSQTNAAYWLQIAPFEEIFVVPRVVGP